MLAVVREVGKRRRWVVVETVSTDRRIHGKYRTEERALQRVAQIEGSRRPRRQ